MLKAITCEKGEYYAWNRKIGQHSRESIVQDGSIVVSTWTIVASNKVGLAVGGRGSSGEAGNGEGSSDFLGEVHIGG